MEIPINLSTSRGWDAFRTPLQKLEAGNEMKERKEVKMGDREGIKGAERNGRNIQSDFDLAKQ